MKNKQAHVPVLLDEVIKYLHIQKNAIYIDATIGAGGHSAEIIRKGGFVIGLDQDKNALKLAHKELKRACLALNKDIESCFTLIHANFRDLQKVARKHSINSAEGILFDLGVSSMQLDTSRRGFSFRDDAPLDMRMDPSTQSITAADLLNTLRVDQLTKLLEVTTKPYYAKKLAKKIVAARSIVHYRISTDLVSAVRKFLPATGKTHPATKLFLALRLAVNSELETLAQSLPGAAKLLKRGGRLAVISFHSDEDSVVKDFIANNTSLKAITKKPITPSRSELSVNPRSRSAKLRVAEKI